MRRRSRFLRCGPAGVDIGSDRRGCDGWLDEAAVFLVNIKSMVGDVACGLSWTPKMRRLAEVERCP